jgi:dienelactone hydrolase
LTGTLSPMRFETDVAAKGVRERRFDVELGERTVPGLLWTPEGDDHPRPVVMLGHGASGSKSQDYVVALARGLVRHRGLCAVAIDGPVHGDRRADRGKVDGLPFADFVARWSADPALIDDMVADWRATLDAVQALPEVTAGPCGYWGLSMGTIFGLPVVAAEPRVTVAVLGLMGIAGPTQDRFSADAPTVRCPLLFIVQWHDELFRRDLAFDLFDAFGSGDKRMHVSPGMHAEVPAEEFEASARMLAEHLLD